MGQGVRVMILFETLALFAALLSLVCVLAVLRRARRPLLRAVGSAACGVGALGAVNLLAGYTGVALALNYVTAFATVVLGAPGVLLLLVLRLLTMG